MSLAESLGWTILRCVVVTGMGLPLSLMCAAYLRQLPSRRRVRAFVIAALAVTFLTPDLLIGYVYANSTLSLVHWPFLNEVLYGVLVLFKVLPPGTALVLLAPASPYSAAAAHSQRLALSADLSRLHQWKTRFGIWLRASGRRQIPVAALIFLLAFQEFEVASLMNATSWTVWLFDAHFRGQFLSESLRLIIGPACITLLAMAPLFLLFRGSPETMDGVESPRQLPVFVPFVLNGVLLLSIFALCVMPFVVEGSRIGDGLTVLLRSATQSRRLARQIGAGIAFGVLSAVPAWLLVRWLLRAPTKVRLAVLLVLCLPGCIGSLVTSLALLSIFQTGPLQPLYDTPVPLIVGLVLFLLPRCALLHVALFDAGTAARLHEVQLLEESNAQQHTFAARRLRWVSQGRPLFLAIAIPAWWSYFNLTMAAVLRPGEMETAPVALYNLMHYGRNAALTAQTFLAVLLPLLFVMLSFGVVWFWAGRKSR